ncbi:sigma factor-like helix-turn-helix DNA-binding protein [Halomonas sp. KAO]|nr:sigma factor-like helix-turn-helix DNA-binding protein [Halomonas sp. KAO]
MRELMGLSTDEICQTLNIKENNCWVILHRARLRLRQCIEEGWLEGEK